MHLQVLKKLFTVCKTQLAHYVHQHAYSQHNEDKVQVKL